MTASPPLNGRKRPPLPVLGDWQSTAPEPDEEQRTSQPEPAVDAEVARARAWAEVEERRIAAEAAAEKERIAAQAEADAARIKAEEEARKQRLANDRQERKDRESAAASDARIAESNRKRAEAERAEREASRQEVEERQAEQAAAKEIADADEKWRLYAIRFAVACGIVALPVQISAFWNPDAWWLVSAPVMLEGGSWVVQRGAASAVANRRPLWHYRVVAWLLALIAAGINLWHGWHAFDPATAIATAFASIAGPGVWDLHENGRIRRRDGALTRRERKAQRKNERAEAALKAAEEKRLAAEKAVADKAAEAARQELRETRKREFPEVWAEAVKIGAALGKAPDDPTVWPRAYRNIEGCDPGESIESISSRRTAERRVESALSGTPVNTLSKTVNAQRANQMPRAQRGPARTPPKRRAGDTQRYVTAARKQASITAKNARRKDSQ